MFARAVGKAKPAGPQSARAVDPTRVPGRDIGNQAMIRLHAPQAGSSADAFQAKLKVGAIDDPLEHEADRVADQVTRMAASDTAPPQVCRDKLQNNEAPAPAPALSAASPSMHRTLRGVGEPLDAATRAYFEPRFGRDFGDVRVHTGAQAAESAREISAHAYTVGRDIAFDLGRFAPGSHEGRRLLAHELTHVDQNRRNSDGATVRRDPAPPQPPRIVSEVWGVAGRAVVVVEVNGQRQAFYRRSTSTDKGRAAGHVGPQEGDWTPFDGFSIRRDPKSGKVVDGYFEKNAYYRNLEGDDPLYGRGTAGNLRTANWLKDQTLPAEQPAEWRFVQAQLQALNVRVKVTLPDETPATAPAPIKPPARSVQGTIEGDPAQPSGVAAPEPPTQFSIGTRALAGVLGVLTVVSEIMGSIARVQDVERSYNARMEATVRFFREFGGQPQFVMEDVDTGVQQAAGTESDTGAVWGRWVAPRLESVNVQALLAALPGRLTTMQSLVEFLGTGRMLQVIEQRGARYYLTGKGVGYVEITQAIERIRSNLMLGLDQRSRAQMAAIGGAGVYRIRSSDVSIYRYATGVREPWRLRHIEVPIITTPEFSGANMWVREVGDKGDRVHVEPANAEAEGLAQNAWYIVPKSVGDVYDEVERSSRTIESRQPADGPLEGFIAAPLPPELGYTRYIKHPNPDWREFTIAIGELRQFWVDRDDLEPVSADQAAAYASGTPAAPPPSHFFRSEERRDLPGF